ncbi:hypothetical protein HZB00_03235 [Candidatus Woesearchaeota archaeon]|nr:hypothetical protein [Candidatus Woesearchaeota archaeon]
MKADLQVYGAIGFQPYWLKAQGYTGKNILQLIVDQCFKQDTCLCSITSHGGGEVQEIPRDSVHDRFGYLVQESSRLPLQYRSGKIGENILAIEKDRRIVYILNSQSVLVDDRGKLLHHLVIGANDLPDFRSLEETLIRAADRGLVQIAEHPFVEANFGIGNERLQQYLSFYDAIEGHNAQLVLPAFLSGFPVVGSYTKRSNEQAQHFAQAHKKQYIATSDAHRIKDIGIAGIEFLGELPVLEEERFLKHLQDKLRSGDFSKREQYVSLPDWMSWVSTFRIGKLLKRV